MNGNISGGGKWFKAAIFQTANDESWVAVNNPDPGKVSAEDKLGPKFPALNNDYSYDATMWSRERISSDSVGDKTFDVTKALKAAVEAGKRHMVLRLQTVAGGFYVDGAREA